MRPLYFAALGCALTLAGCTSKDTAAATRSAAAGPAMLRDVARLTGTVKPSDSLVVKSEVSGQIKQLLIKAGDFVKKGQLLIDIDREQLQLKRDQLQIAVETARLTLKAAERDFERAKSQISTGTVSTDHVQDLEFARDKAKLTLRNAELDLKSNLRDLANTRIVSPRDGQVIALNVTEGEMATSVTSASGGTSLAVLADPRDLKVVVEVSELDFPRLKLGQKVEVSTESQSNKLLIGRVSYIPPGAQASASNSSVMVFKVEVTLDKNVKPVDYSEVAGGAKRQRRGEGKKPDTTASAALKAAARADSSNTSLVPGMTVNVDFVFLERKAEVTVPYGMVSTSSDGMSRTVWVRSVPGAAGEAKEEKAPKAKTQVSGFRPKRIQLGATDYKNYEVLGGIALGDTIFSAPDTSKAGGRKAGPGGPP
jgi:RND family efflux transporter MFP subunit